VSDDEKSPIDQALDLFVYAPLGFALSFREFSKQAAEKGRQQVQVAKMMGQFAAQMAGQQAEQKLSGARKQAEEVVGSFLPGGGRPSHVPAAPAPKPAATTTAAKAEHVQTSAPPSTAPVTAPADPSVRTTTPDVPRTPPASSTPAPGAATLAIPAYDTLSASQVVQRLAGLSADELEAVRAYETAGRARKTILNKVEQLK
jgi:hypothetical protein